MTVRRLTPEDALLWREVRLRMLSPDPENYGASYADWADRPVAVRGHALRRAPHVASMAKGRAVGAMGLWPHPGRSAGHRGTLIAVWVEPEWRGRGRAQAMLNETAAIAEQRGIRQIELNVNAANARAVRFYARHGFVRFGELPRAHQHEGVFADELLMVKMLGA